MKKDKISNSQIVISMPDGEGGLYKREKVKKFLKENKSKLKPDELAKGKDFNLLMKFHKENF